MKAYLAELAASKKFGRGTLKNILAIVRAILSHAANDSLIPTNPAFRLGRIALANARKRAVEFMTRLEAERFPEASKKLRPRRYPLFLTALRTGLRLGELLALDWADVQFGESAQDPNRYILVRRNFTRGQFTTPKSGKERRVDLSRELRQVLTELRGQRMRGAFGREEVRVEGLVFPSDTGGPLDGVNLYHRDFLPCLEAAGLRRVTFHALRHSFASLLIQNGASLAYVKEQMGHSSIQVTVDVYGHLLPGANIDWIDRLDSPPSPQLSATQTQPDPSEELRDYSQALEIIGGPARIRTWDQRIMSSEKGDDD